MRLRSAIASQPSPDNAGAHAELSAQRRLSKALRQHATPKKPTTFRRVRAESARVHESAHHERAGCTDLATMSRHKDESGTPVSGDSSQVPDHRSEKYRERMIGAGRRVRFAREEADWSLRELAEKSGVDKGQISRFETGENLEISAGRFFDLCEALALDPVYVWTGKTRRGPGRDDRTSAPPPPPSPPRPTPAPSSVPASGERPSKRPAKR